MVPRKQHSWRCVWLGPGEDDGGFVARLWAQKVGEASSRLCNIRGQAWVHLYARWLPMDFLKSKAQRDVELHGDIVSMDSEEFRAHSVGFYKRADQWFGRHLTSHPCAPSLQPEDADMSKHVFAADSDGRDLTSLTTPNDNLQLERGPLRPFSSAAVSNEQPPVCNAATSHFVASNRRVGASVFQPFWSLSTRPGSQLQILPMQGPSP